MGGVIAKPKKGKKHKGDFVKKMVSDSLLCLKKGCWNGSMYVNVDFGLVGVDGWNTLNVILHDKLNSKKTGQGTMASLPTLQPTRPLNIRVFIRW
jgi:hypothetical protein